jgi:hypothetical protein
MLSKESFNSLFDNEGKCQGSRARWHGLIVKRTMARRTTALTNKDGVDINMIRHSMTSSSSQSTLPVFIVVVSRRPEEVATVRASVLVVVVICPRRFVHLFA